MGTVNNVKKFSESGIEMRIIEYFRWAKRVWWIVVVSALIGGGVGFLYVQARVPVYVSETTLLAVTPARVPTYVQLASSDEVLTRAYADAGVDDGSEDVNVLAETARNSNILTLTVKAASSEIAYDLGVAVADEIVQRAEELELKIDPERAQPLSIVTATKLDGDDHETALVRFVLVGLAAGIAVGAFVASVYDRFFRRIRGEKEVAALTGRAPLARGVLSAKSSTVTLDDEPMLARRLKELVAAGGASVSVLPLDDHQAVTVTIARELAKAVRPTFESVVVVDAAWRTRPSRRKPSTSLVEPGLSDLLVAEAHLSDVIVRNKTTGFDVIEAGRRPVNADKLLASDTFSTLIRELSTIYELVLVAGNYPTRDPFSGKPSAIDTGSVIGAGIIRRSKRGMASLVRNAKGESIDGFVLLKYSFRK